MRLWYFSRKNFYVRVNRIDAISLFFAYLRESSEWVEKMPYLCCAILEDKKLGENLVYSDFLCNLAAQNIK